MSVFGDRSKHLEVPLYLTGAMAAWVVTVGYLFILPVMTDLYIGRVFVNSGWVGWSIALLGVWSLVILVVRWVYLNQASAAIDQDMLPHTLGPTINRFNAGECLRFLQCRFTVKSANPLAARLERSLKQLANGHGSATVMQDLRSGAATQVDAVEAHYAMVRAFVWAVPILGFVGTVLGIGQAIGGFSSTLSQAEDLAMVKSSLGHVVSGLAVAFDTTFLGLIVSLIIMFPLNLMVRREHRFLAALDEACGDQLVARMQEGHHRQAKTPQGDVAMENTDPRASGFADEGPT